MFLGFLLQLYFHFDLAFESSILMKILAGYYIPNLSQKIEVSNYQRLTQKPHLLESWLVTLDGNGSGLVNGINLQHMLHMPISYIKNIYIMASNYVQYQW